MLQAWRPVDGTEGPKHTQHTENLEEADARAAEDGDEGDGDDHHVQDVEGNPAKSSLVEEESVRYELEAALQREDSREEVIEVSKRLKQLKNCKAHQNQNQYLQR